MTLSGRQAELAGRLRGRDLSDPIELPTLAPGGTFDVTLRPPGSKSLTNRAILLASLATGTSRVRGALLDADDARRMLSAARALGASIAEQNDELVITGVAGRPHVPPGGLRLDVGNAGTAMRFLVAAGTLADHPVTFDGDARMRQRPIGALAEALRQLGCRVAWEAQDGFPPVTITPPARLPSAPSVEIGPGESSQFISGLLMAGAFLPGGLTLRLTAAPVSASYIDMTLALLAGVGVSVRTSENLRCLRVAGASEGLNGFEYQIEPDASGATYFWAAAAMTPGARCRIEGIGPSSLQGDALFHTLLARMGAQTRQSTARGEEWTEVVGTGELRPIMADMSDMPDAVMTLAAVATRAPGTSIIRGIRTLRVKESDRVEATRAELAKVGVLVESPVQADADAMTLTPTTLADSPARPVMFETYRDHRMAMSLSLLALHRAGVCIRDPRCVEKTYPHYWRDFAKLFSPS